MNDVCRLFVNPRNAPAMRQFYERFTERSPPAIGSSAGASAGRCCPTARRSPRPPSAAASGSP
jgi:hypothetical protein